jgi:hypothetical protein
MVFEIPFAVSDLRDLLGAIEQLVSMAQSFEFCFEYGDTRLFFLFSRHKRLASDL